MRGIYGIIFQEGSHMKDLTVGKPWSLLWRFALPLIISVVFQQLYNISDSFIVGNWSANGQNGVSAIGAAYPVNLIFMSFAYGSNIGCSVIISQIFGSKDFTRLKNAVYTSFIGFTCFAFILMGIGIFTVSPILRALGTPADIMGDSQTYLNIMIYGMPFLFIYNICNGMSAAMGDSKTPLIFLICSSLGNIVVSFLFVAGFGWGVAGAAWATFICQGMSAVLAAVVLLRRVRAVRTARRVSLFSFAMMSKILMIAVPSIIQQTFVSVGSLALQALINQFGSDVIAGYATAVKIIMLVVSIVGTIGSAASSFTAQNYGAGKKLRIHEGFKAALVLMVITVIPLSAACLLFAPQLVRLFMSDASPAAVKVGSYLIYFAAPAFVLVSTKLISDGILRGMGKMRVFMISTFTDLLVRIILAYIFAPWLGVNGIWLAWPVGWTVGVTMSTSLYRHFVLKKVVKKEQKRIAAFASIGITARKEE